MSDTPETKTCPQCISDVPAEASTCRHCQYVWPDSDLGRAQEQAAWDRTWANLFLVALAVVLALIVFVVVVG